MIGFWRATFLFGATGGADSIMGFPVIVRWDISVSFSTLSKVIWKFSAERLCRSENSDWAVYSLLLVLVDGRPTGLYVEVFNCWAAADDPWICCCTAATAFSNYRLDFLSLISLLPPPRNGVTESTADGPPFSFFKPSSAGPL